MHAMTQSKPLSAQGFYTEAVHLKNAKYRSPAHRKQLVQQNFLQTFFFLPLTRLLRDSVHINRVAFVSHIKLTAMTAVLYLITPGSSQGQGEQFIYKACFHLHR